MSTTSKPVNLALQGGGAHGAFTWGVLDRLLEEERMSFEGICATSAGAMNATVMAHGLTIGGRDGAKLSLADFWRRISEAAAWGPLQPSPFDRLMGYGSIETSPALIFFDIMTRLLSPYEFNPLNYNPLRDVLEETVDFERLRKENVVKLFLCATNVRTGKVKIFENDEVTLSAVLASGCLPLLFQAIEIDGEAYWDGGYMGNPAIFPLIYQCQSTDVIVIHINPIVREGIPRTASDILNRLNEISFNSSLMREMRAIAFANKLVNRGVLGDEIKTMLIHAIEAELFMKDLGVASKYNADWNFLTHLRDVGRSCADKWLTANFCHVGTRSTIDIHARYL
ncbi:patatin-like phospholipase family protein [Bradyrhizobium sp. WSM1253]|uniref:patatin-like phospholipase family protein n=1 Tax=Bradyrhizobium sp. WSM1253 TaxID=319003 RepID=UPI00025D1228|nr:patatin-like phospholipase family protein [Bradyrhizobium sp. WSM1253]EIG63598.1 putative esterase of the alpha-beta hydrolase superfamily [Bradyrhizobium sp. WSM1253]